MPRRAASLLLGERRAHCRRAANSRRCRETLETLTALRLTPAEAAKVRLATDLPQRRNYRELSELSWDTWPEPPTQARTT